MIFRVDAQGDVVYVGGASREEATARFKRVFGDIPEELLKWTQVFKLPKGETLI